MSAATLTPANQADLLRGISTAEALAEHACTQALAACTTAERNEWETLAATATTNADNLRSALAALVARPARRCRYR